MTSGILAASRRLVLFVLHRIAMYLALVVSNAAFNYNVDLHFVEAIANINMWPIIE